MRIDGLHCMAGEEYIRVDEYEKLDAENQKLKAEVERLRSENKILKSTIEHLATIREEREQG